MRAAKPDWTLVKDSADSGDGTVRRPTRSNLKLDQDRQLFLEALPMAAVVLDGRRNALVPIGVNEAYEALERQLSGHARAAPGFLLHRAGLRAELERFRTSGCAASEFAWDDGSVVGARHFQLRLIRLPEKNWSNGRVLLTFLDRTSEVETERSLRAEMLHDSLTGLPNRAAFGEALDAVIHGSGETCDGHAVLIVDLTRFSRVNECMGSLAGDELIITAARRLVSVVRSGDTLARIGGDEFAILLQLKDGPGDALHAARRVQAALATPFRLSELEIRVDSAVGCALLDEVAGSSQDVVRNAQFALKRAKLSGRIEIYQPGEATEARRRFSLETELRRAIERDQLQLAFQPLIDLQTGGVHGFEALARWDHPDRGAISPVEFIPVAEESGLIVPLGRWAFHAAFRTLASWDAAAGHQLPLQIGVNLSAIQLARDDVAKVVEDLLAANGVTGSRLTVELTESAIIRDPERAMRVLSALKGLDAKIAMDDFGTGYSSLAYLQKLPIDLLKIDRSFVTGMLGDRDSVGIVRAVLSLAATLGMETTAEGIETVEVAQTLAALGCLWGQGYYFGRPLSSADAFAYYLDRRS